MTDREKAIVMAYTGTCMLAGDKLGIYYQYIQEKLGHCVMTHELAYPEVQDAIRKATKDDFIELCRANDEPRVMALEEIEDWDGPVFFEACETDMYYALIETVEPTAGMAGAFVFVNVVPGEHHRRVWGGENYGSIWRCWTSRPDEKRRAETPWES